MVAGGLGNRNPVEIIRKYWTLSTPDAIVAIAALKSLKDSYIFDIKRKTITAANDLPCADTFSSPSTIVLGNNLYAVGDDSGVFKFDIKTGKWTIAHQFK